jgi:hypothetical protein
MFSLVSARFDDRHLLTSRSRPGGIFGEETVAAAMIDRLVHHAETLALAGDSYRLKDQDLGPVEPRSSSGAQRFCARRGSGFNRTALSASIVRSALERGSTFNRGGEGQFQRDLRRELSWKRLRATWDESASATQTRASLNQGQRRIERDNALTEPNLESKTPYHRNYLF